MPPQVEAKTLTKNDQVLSTRKLGDQKKADGLQIVIKFAAYQKEQNNSELSLNRRNHGSISLINVINDINSKIAEALGCMPNLSALLG